MSEREGSPPSATTDGVDDDPATALVGAAYPDGSAISPPITVPDDPDPDDTDDGEDDDE